MPLIALSDELKSSHPRTEIIFVTERGGKFTDVIEERVKGANIKKIFAGKLRRYHGVSLWQQSDVKTILLNIRDVFYLLIGFFQSLWLLIRKRPNVILFKGGFVSLPVGLASWLLRIPYVTHDSDTMPSLTNKIIGKGARFNLMALTDKCSSYDQAKIMKVGVPVSSSFSEINEKLNDELRHELGIPGNSIVVLVVGGSIGADRLNKAISEVSDRILEHNPTMYLVHQTGTGQVDYSGISNNRLITVDFINNMSTYGAIADIIVSRAGATAISEFATAKKALILIPNPNLTGGHQLENAELLSKNNATIIVNESPKLGADIAKQIQNLVSNTEHKKELEKNIEMFSSKRSAKDIAVILQEMIK